MYLCVYGLGEWIICQNRLLNGCLFWCTLSDMCQVQNNNLWNDGQSVKCWITYHTLVSGYTKIPENLYSKRKEFIQGDTEFKKEIILYTTRDFYCQLMTFRSPQRRRPFYSHSDIALFCWANIFLLNEFYILYVFLFVKFTFGTKNRNSGWWKISVKLLRKAGKI